MSIKCKYITSDKLSYNNLRFICYLCDDMSITKTSDKKYHKINSIEKDHPCFGYLEVCYLKNPMLYVTTPVMKCLWGVQKKGGNSFQMNLQFTDLEEDPYMKSFFDFVQNTEFMCMKKLGLTEEDADKFVSEIQYDKNEIYEPSLQVKLPFRYNQFLVDLYSDFSSSVNIFSINKFQKMECDLFVDRVWRMNDKFYMKWKCKIIHMV